MSGYSEPSGGTASPPSDTQYGSKPIRAIMALHRGVTLDSDPLYGSIYIPKINTPWHIATNKLYLDDPDGNQATILEIAALAQNQRIRIPEITNEEAPNGRVDDAALLRQSQEFHNKTLRIDGPSLNRIRDSTANASYIVSFDASGYMVKLAQIASKGIQHAQTAYLDAAQTFTETQTISKNTDQVLILHRPSNGAVENGMRFTGLDSLGATKHYAAIKVGFTITTAGAEQSYIAFHNMAAGNLAHKLVINYNGDIQLRNLAGFSGIITPTSIDTSNRTYTLPNGSMTFAGTNIAGQLFTQPQKIQHGNLLLLTLYRTTSTNGSATGIEFSLNNSAAAETVMAAVYGYVSTNTAGSEVGRLSIWTKDAGSMAERLRLDTRARFQVAIGELQVMTIYRPVNSSGSALIYFNLQNTSSVESTYGYIGVRSETVTAGSHGGSVQLGGAVSGSLQLLMKIQEYKTYLYNASSSAAILDSGALTTSRFVSFPDATGKVMIDTFANVLTAQTKWQYSGSYALVLYRPVATGGNGLGMQFNLQNSSAAEITYAEVFATNSVVTPGSESGTFYIYTRHAGALALKLQMSAGDTTIFQRTNINQTGANDHLRLQRGVSTGGSAAGLTFQLHNTNSTFVQYAQIHGGIGSSASDNVAGAENGQVQVWLKSAGTDKLSLQFTKDWFILYDAQLLLSWNATDHIVMRRLANLVGQNVGMLFQHWNSSNQNITYGALYSRVGVNTAGAETGYMDILLRNNGTVGTYYVFDKNQLSIGLSGIRVVLDSNLIASSSKTFQFPNVSGTLAVLSTANVFTTFQKISYAASLALVLYRPENTLATGTGIAFNMTNSAASELSYCYLFGSIIANTAGAETGAISFQVRNAGTLREIFLLHGDGTLAIGVVNQRLVFSGAGLTANRTITAPNYSGEMVLDAIQTKQIKEGSYEAGANLTPEGRGLLKGLTFAGTIGTTTNLNGTFNSFTSASAANSLFGCHLFSGDAGYGVTRRAYNPVLFTKLGIQKPLADSRFYWGMTNKITVIGSTDTPFADTEGGVLIGWRSTDTNIMVFYNDSTPTPPAPIDTGIAVPTSATSYYFLILFKSTTIEWYIYNSGMTIVASGTISTRVVGVNDNLHFMGAGYTTSVNARFVQYNILKIRSEK